MQIFPDKILLRQSKPDFSFYLNLNLNPGSFTPEIF